MIERTLMDIAGAVQWLSERDPTTVGLVLVMVAFAEVVIPGVPGDVIALATAVMVFGFHWPLWSTLSAWILGSVLGGMFNFGLGAWLHQTNRISWLGPRTQAVVDEALAGFERRGPALLAMNRFLPGIRGFFFVAAGMGSIGWRDALGWGAVGAALWYGALFTAGWLVGTNLDRLQTLVVAEGWVLGTVVAVGLVSYALYRRFYAGAASDPLVVSRP
jgi:membrane protein DedA with SNARE-associated domain